MDQGFAEGIEALKLYQECKPRSGLLSANDIADVYNRTIDLMVKNFDQYEKKTPLTGNDANQFKAKFAELRGDFMQAYGIGAMSQCDADNFMLADRQVNSAPGRTLKK